MKEILFFLFISLITFSSLSEVEEDSKKEYSFNYGSIIVTDEQIGVCEKLIGYESLKMMVKKEAKNYESLGEKFVNDYGEVFTSLKKVGSSALSNDINILVGLLGSKFELLFNRRITSFKLIGDYEKDFKKFYTEAKDGEEGKWYIFKSIYNDTVVSTQVNSLMTFIYKRSDDKFDVIFVSSSQEFSIPPIKVLKPKDKKENDKEKQEDKNNKDKEKKNEEEEEYDLIYPSEYNEEQKNSIQKWFELVNLKGLCTLVGITL